MFTLQIPPGYFLHWQQRLGAAANALSPIPELLKPFGEIIPADEPDARLPVSEEALGRAIAALAAPAKRLTVRHGGNLIDPEQFQVCVGADAVAFAALTAAGNIFVHCFDSLDEWIAWTVKQLDPSATTQAGEPPVKGPLTYPELVHLLHAADTYRRCHYQSMLDYVPAQPSFDTVDYARHLREAVCSIDHRWLLPCLLMLLPESVPASLDNMDGEFDRLLDWKLIERGADETAGHNLVFTDHGRRWAEDLMRGWTTALGLHVTVLDGEPRPARQGLFVLATIRNAHVYLISDAKVQAAAMAADALKPLLGKLVAEAAPTAKPPAEPVETPTPADAAQPTPRNFCPQCGAPLQPGDVFCTGCGAKLE